MGFSKILWVEFGHFFLRGLTIEASLHRRETPRNCLLKDLAGVSLTGISTIKRRNKIKINQKQFFFEKTNLVVNTITTYAISAKYIQTSSE